MIEKHSGVLSVEIRISGYGDGQILTACPLIVCFGMKLIRNGLSKIVLTHLQVLDGRHHIEN